MLTATQFCTFTDSRHAKADIVLVTHASCPDGSTCGVLFRNFIDPRGRIIFEQPSSPGLAVQTRALLDEGVWIIFADIAPPREMAEELRDSGRCIVIDHHAGQKDIVELFGDYGLYSDAPGDCGAYLLAKLLSEVLDIRVIGSTDTGCELAHFRQLAYLVGLGDTWAKYRLYLADDENFAADDTETLDIAWNNLRNLTNAVRFARVPEEVVKWEAYIGDVQVINAHLKDHNASDRAKLMDLIRRDELVTGLATWKVGILPSTHITDLADEAEVDLLIGYSFFSNDAMSVSLRSRNELLDCSLIAKSIKGCTGGGHRGAAGFRVPVALLDGPPEKVALRLVREGIEAGHPQPETLA